MRTIKYIAIHCTATSQLATVASIQRYWKEKLGWKSPGYHFLIEPNGKINELLPIDQVSNGVAGFNHCTINIAYIGGIYDGGKPIDNRTPEQIEAMKKLVKQLKAQFPTAIVQGHRDFPNVKKDCPCFDAKEWYLNLTI